MKKMYMIILAVAVALSAGQAFALPGVYNMGANTQTLLGTACETRTISLDATGFGTSPLVSGGFLLENSNELAVDITACDCSAAVGSPFDQPVTPVFDPTGYPGGVFVAATNLGAGVTPSANIVVCTVTFCGVGRRSLLPTCALTRSLVLIPGLPRILPRMTPTSMGTALP